jgi:hypothetical protein
MLRAASRRRWLRALAVVTWTAASGAAGARAGGGPESMAGRLAALEARVMTADYRADLAALARGREEATQWVGDDDWGYLARYWAGFASWRSAINGSSLEQSQEELKAHLERAAADFEVVVAERPTFADGLAAAAGVHGWLARFYPDEPRTMTRHLLLYFTRLRRARELEPDNPRVLWVDASVDLYTPVQLGGDPLLAVVKYRRMLALAVPPRPGDPLPDWGEPEAWMSLAYAHANQAQPDLPAAREEARAALRLRPDWAYVRDVLLPPIEAALAARSAAADPRREP